MDIEKLIRDVRDAIVEGTERVANSILDSEAFDKYRNSEKMDKFIENVNQSFSNLAENAGEWFDKAKESSEPFIKKTKASIYDRFYDEYRKSGMEFGDSHEGFTQWINQNANDVRKAVENGLDKSMEFIAATAHSAKEAVEKTFIKKEDDAADDGVTIETPALESVMDQAAAEADAEVAAATEEPTGENNE